MVMTRSRRARRDSWHSVWVLFGLTLASFFFASYLVYFLLEKVNGK